MKNVFVILLSVLLLSSCAKMGQDNASRQQSTVLKQHKAEEQPKLQLPDDAMTPGLPPLKVAILVPLSGKYAELGKNLLDAAQLALFNINEPNLILVPFDSKGTVGGAVEAANRAMNEDVKLILGPVFSSSASAIAPIAAEKGVSIVSFSNDEALANSGVFAIGFRPEQQMKRIINYAMDSGIEDFTAIIPGNNYGAVVARQLKEATDSNPNTSILKAELFRLNKNGTPVDLTTNVNAIFNAAMTAPSKNKTDAIKYPRAMLIPESGKNLTEITSLLANAGFDKSKIQLLGGEQWYADEVMKNPVMQGGWFAAPLRERRDNFKQKFISVFGYEPMNIASLAYDGVALAMVVARSSGADNISREALLNPRGFFGVDGIFRFTENGLTERGLAVMVIKDGNVQVISPAPTSFADAQ